MNRITLIILGLLCAGFTTVGILYYDNPADIRMESYYEDAFNKTYAIFGEMNFPNSMVYGPTTTEEFEHLRLHYRMESRIFRSGDLDALDFLRRKIIDSEDDGVEQCCALKILKEINTKQSWELLSSFSSHPNECIRDYVQQCRLEYQKDAVRELPEYQGLKLYNNQNKK